MDGFNPIVYHLDNFNDGGAILDLESVGSSRRPDSVSLGRLSSSLRYAPDNEFPDSRWVAYDYKETGMRSYISAPVDGRIVLDRVIPVQKRLSSIFGSLETELRGPAVEELEVGAQIDYINNPSFQYGLPPIGRGEEISFLNLELGYENQVSETVVITQHIGGFPIVQVTRGAGGEIQEWPAGTPWRTLPNNPDDAGDIPNVGFSGVGVESWLLESGFLGPVGFPFYNAAFYDEDYSDYGDAEGVGVELSKARDAYGSITCTPSTTTWIPYFSASKSFTREQLPEGTNVYDETVGFDIELFTHRLDVSASLFGYWSDGRHLREMRGPVDFKGGSLSASDISGALATGQPDPTPSSRDWPYNEPNGLIDRMTGDFPSKMGHYWPVTIGLGSVAGAVSIPMMTQSTTDIPFGFDFTRAGYFGVSHMSLLLDCFDYKWLNSQDLSLYREAYPASRTGLSYIIAVYDIFESPFDDISSTCYTSGKRVHFRSNGVGFLGKMMIALVIDPQQHFLENRAAIEEYLEEREKDPFAEYPLPVLYRIFATKKLREKNVVIDCDRINSGDFFNDWDFIPNQNFKFFDDVAGWGREFQFGFFKLEPPPDEGEEPPPDEGEEPPPDEGEEPPPDEGEEPPPDEGEDEEEELPPDPRYYDPRTWDASFWLRNSTFKDDEGNYIGGSPAYTDLTPSPYGVARDYLRGRSIPTPIGLYSSYSLRKMPQIGFFEYCASGSLFLIPSGVVTGNPIYPSTVRPNVNLPFAYIGHDDMYLGEPDGDDDLGFIKIPGVENHPNVSISSYSQAVGFGGGGWKIGSL